MGLRFCLFPHRPVGAFRLALLLIWLFTWLMFG